MTRQKESGNALVYVLIVIALFAALSFTLARQTDTSEAGSISEDKAKVLATQLLAYAGQTQAVLDQMVFSGTTIDEIDFILPSDAAFNTAPNLDKVYHPDGGGLIPGKVPEDAIILTISDPMPGWYLSRFNNVDWTESNAEEVILVAYQIRKEVCEQINKTLTGSTAIPLMNDSIKEAMIDDTFYSSGTNLDFTTTAPTDVCPACHEVSSLCVQNQGQNAYGFYSVVAQQ